MAWSILVIAAAAVALPAEIVDGVVAVVEGQPIKHSDVIREIRLTAFMNHEEIDRRPAAQKEAVSRLIDQAIIRQEIAASLPAPTDRPNPGALLEQLRESYGAPEVFRQRLAAYGINEEDLQRQLEWQVTVLQFVEFRFGQGDPAEGEAAVNEQFFGWLDQMRKQKRIEIREDRLL